MLREIVRFIVSVISYARSRKYYLISFIHYHSFNKIYIGKSNKFEKNVRMSFRRSGNVSIANTNHFCRDCKIIIDGGSLEVHSNCTFGEGNIFNVFSHIIFGDSVLTADRVSFITNIHNYEDVTLPIKHQSTTSDAIEIGDGTWLGINVVILAGTKIGKNCVVAANAVVKGNFPDYCVIAGIPAKIVKQYNSKSKYWEKNIRSY